MTKHPKMKKPSDADLRSNPLIGASKGATLSGASPDDLDESQGANTLEGDLENDVNVAGESTSARAGQAPAQNEGETEAIRWLGADDDAQVSLSFRQLIAKVSWQLSGAF
jgi:hypothetical protein